MIATQPRAASLLLVGLLLGGFGIGRDLRAGAALSRQAPAEEKFAPARTTLDRILTRYTEQIGGADAWQEARSIVREGECAYAGSDIRGTAEIYQRAPDRMAIILTLQRIGVSRQVIDGNKGWESYPGKAVHVLKGKELDQLRWDADFYKEIHLRHKYAGMKLRGILQSQGHPVYVVDAQPSVGKLQRLYFDVASGLLVRQDLMQTDGTPMLAFFDEYRLFQGIRLPVVWRTVTSADILTIRWKTIEINRPFSDSVFQIPARSN